MSAIYDFKAKAINGEEISFEQYKGKAVLIVNTASKCGFTPQFEGLEKLHQEYGEQGLAILGFPCNQFGGQEPGAADEIHSFCQKNYGVSFQMFDKVDVNGDAAHPLFKYLKKEKGGFLISKIKWNFTKFLVDTKGEVVERYAPTTKPKDISKRVVGLLG